MNLAEFDYFHDFYDLIFLEHFQMNLHGYPASEKGKVDMEEVGIDESYQQNLFSRNDTLLFSLMI